MKTQTTTRLAYLAVTFAVLTTGFQNCAPSFRAESASQSSSSLGTDGSDAVDPSASATPTVMPGTPVAQPTSVPVPTATAMATASATPVSSTATPAASATPKTATPSASPTASPTPRAATPTASPTPSPTPSVPPTGGLSTATYKTVAIGTKYSANGYMEYLPAGYGAPGASVPLMIALHGHGQIGSGSSSDLAKLSQEGITKLISQKNWPASRPFVVLAPQTTQNSVGSCWDADEIHNFITYAVKNYNIDAKRVYLTGLSCGALGSANYFAKYGSQQIAASVLISGAIEPAWDSQGCTLINQMGLWAFHGSADGTVPVTYDHTYMPDFMACPQPPRKDVRYVEYPGAPHDVWNRTYDLSAGYDIYSWLLMFSK